MTGDGLDAHIARIRDGGRAQPLRIPQWVHDLAVDLADGDADEAAARLDQRARAGGFDGYEVVAIEEPRGTLLGVQLPPPVEGDEERGEEQRDGGDEQPPKPPRETERDGH